MDGHLPSSYSGGSNLVRAILALPQLGWRILLQEPSWDLYGVRLFPQFTAGFMSITTLPQSDSSSARIKAKFVSSVEKVGKANFPWFLDNPNLKKTFQNQCK